MDNATRQALLDKIKATGYPGSIIDVFSAYEQGVDLIDQHFQEQQKQQEIQQAKQQIQNFEQPAQQPEIMRSSPPQSISQIPSPKLNYTQAKEPTPQEDKLIKSQSNNNIGLVNTPTGSYK